MALETLNDFPLGVYLLKQIFHLIFYKYVILYNRTSHFAIIYYFYLVNKKIAILCFINMLYYKSHYVAMSWPLLIVIAIRQINLNMRVNDYKKN